MSMGFGIYLAGHERTASSYANFMYHEISTASWGKNQEIQRVTQENKRLQKMYDSLVIEQTNIKQETLENVKETLRDWFFDANEAMNMGVVHKII
ncbi:ATP-dependent Clp protease proteolytic subunit [compost metagenome]